MIPIKVLMWRAASVAATDPRVQRQAAKVYKAHVEPRAKQAWAKARPKIAATGAQVRATARETNPIRHPITFAARAGKALRTPPAPSRGD